MADYASSDDDKPIGKRKMEDDENEDEGDDEDYSLSDEEDEEAKLARLEREQEEEIKKHRIMMAKRAAKKEEIKARKAKGELISPEEEAQTPFRSSKGFAKMTGSGANQESALILSMKKDEFLFLCPFPKCGRKFTSDVQLKDHMNRRHKKPEEEKGADKQNQLKNTNVFQTQKRMSAKGAEIMEDKN
jgi:hypothetical protein